MFIFLVKRLSMKKKPALKQSDTARNSQLRGLWFSSHLFFSLSLQTKLTISRSCKISTQNVSTQRNATRVWPAKFVHYGDAYEASHLFAYTHSYKRNIIGVCWGSLSGFPKINIARWIILLYGECGYKAKMQKREKGKLRRPKMSHFENPKWTWCSSI